MDFTSAISIVASVLTTTNTIIDSNDYDGLIVKKLEASNTLDDNRTTNQTHIAITGQQMDIFPYLRSDGYFNEKESDIELKKYFITQIPVFLYKTNINYLSDDNHIDISFNDKTKKSYTSIVRSKRKHQADQIQVSLINFDSDDFVIFRKMLHAGSYLIVLKKKEKFCYDVFGIVPNRNIEGDGQLSSLNNKFFKLTTKTTVNVDELLFDDTYVPTLSENERKKFGENIIYYGIPGCGKSYHIENNVLNGVNKDENVFRTTFYLDYSNSDFIGQIYPKVTDDHVTYEPIPGPFTKALERALKTDEMIYLVIEEINRGNAAAIFGDAFQLLDRLSADKDGRVVGDSEYPISNEFIESYLTKQGVSFTKGKIYIPHNLTLLATMNTSDQNVFPLDTAFKRRWDRKKITTDWNEVDDIKDMYIPCTDITWETFARTINEKMLQDSENGDVSIAEDKQMGPYFVKKSMLSTEKNDNDKDKMKSFISNVIDYLYNDVTKFDHKVLFNQNVYSYDNLYDIILGYKESTSKSLFDSVFNSSVNEALNSSKDNIEDENDERN